MSDRDLLSQFVLVGKDTGIIGQRLVWIENDHGYYTKITTSQIISFKTVPLPSAPIPLHEIYTPLPQPHLTIASLPLSSTQYLKRPFFSNYEPVEPNTVPELPTLQLAEATFCELLLSKPHANVVKYFGVVPHTSNSWIVGLALEEYPHELCAVIEERGEGQKYEGFQFDGQKLVNGLKAGVAHIHSLDYVHNDLRPDNIMLDKDLNTIVIDFDAVKKVGSPMSQTDKRAHEDWRVEVDVASFESDWESVRRLEKYILEGWRPDEAWKELVTIVKSS